MKMYNVIEIDPYLYSINGIDSTTKRRSESEVDIFWRTSIADRNLDTFNPVIKGSYLVDLNTIGDHELVEIINYALEDVELNDFDQQVGALAGGITILQNEKIVIKPMCCGDLGNILEWEQIFEKPKNQWHSLWIGHPWIFTRRKNGVIEFSGYFEKNIEEIDEILPLYEISESVLKKNLLRLRKELALFRSRLEVALDSLSIQNSDKISSLMVG